MAVKLLMTWDIRPGREQEYFEFLVREFMPGVQKLGMQPSEAWVTTYGKQPQIMTGMIAENLVSVHKVLAGDEWKALHDRLLEYVVNFKEKVVWAKNGFQM